MSDGFISQLVITDSLFCHFRFHKKLLNDELIIKPVMQEKIYLIEILIEIYYVWVRIPSFSAQGKVKWSSLSKGSEIKVWWIKWIDVDKLYVFWKFLAWQYWICQF